MLSNYDATAIAAVMGLGFRRIAAPAAAGDFSILVDGATVHVVEATTPGGDAPSFAHIEKAVEHGLPRQALRHLAEDLAGGDKALATQLQWGVVPKTTLDRRATQLSPQESERTERVARLFVHASRALGTTAEAREFMTAPHPELDNRSPIEAARTDLGTRRVERLLTALEYGLAL
ncbi:MAG: antitoxin Xre/MbcA/ParS toxin-binding domain-containing protein [Paracraurococcus sp.]